MSSSLTPSLDASVGLTAQRLPSYLPAIYRADPFIGQYLWAFEQVLLDLEAKVGGMATLFDPFLAPEDFVPWLSTWVAFTLRADLSLQQQRSFIARIISLYRRRGTKGNLQDLLGIFTRGTPTIVESNDQAHHFHITLHLFATAAGGQSAAEDPSAAEQLRRQIAIARALIELEKPAHTTYDLELLFPTMQIGVTSHIGVDTLLGTEGEVAGGSTAVTTAPKAALTRQASRSTPTRERPKPKAKQDRPKAKAKSERPTKAKQERRKSKAQLVRPKSKSEQERPTAKAKPGRSKAKPKSKR